MKVQFDGKGLKLCHKPCTILNKLLELIFLFFFSFPFHMQFWSLAKRFSECKILGFEHLLIENEGESWKYIRANLSIISRIPYYCLRFCGIRIQSLRFTLKKYFNVGKNNTKQCCELSYSVFLHYEICTIAGPTLCYHRKVSQEDSLPVTG